MKHAFTPRARQLRREQTPAEYRLWSRLRNRNLMHVKFRRHIPVRPYTADFMCKQANLIIDADGGQHSGAEPYDQKRTKYLENKGFQVLRFWNHEILNDTDAVIEVIAEAVHWATHPANAKHRQKPPRPTKGGERVLSTKVRRGLKTMLTSSSHVYGGGVERIKFRDLITMRLPS